MKTEIQEYKDLFLKHKGKKELIEEELDKSEKKKDKLDKKLQSIEKAQAFIQIVAKDTQEGIKFHISDIVQLALDAVFPGRYNFEVQFEIKRNQTEASLDFYDQGKKINPMTGSGGGLVNTACLALRMVAWSLGRTNPVIILDEPFSNLSADLQPKAGEILRELSDKLGIQIIMVTHNRETMIEIADKIIDVSLYKEGKWEVSKTKEIGKE